MAAALASLLLMVGGVRSAAAAGLSLMVEARHIRDDATQAIFEVKDGSVLRSGDGLRITLEIHETQPVYLVFLGSSGKPTVVLPGSREDVGKALPAGTVIQVPPRGTFFPLDDNTGDEAIFAFTGPGTAEDLDDLLQAMRAADGDVAQATRAILDRFDDVERVAFQHISAGPLVGIDTAAPELRRSVVEEDAEDAEADTTAMRLREEAGRARRPAFVIPQDVGDERSEVLSEEGTLIPPGVGRKPAQPGATAQD